MMRQSCLVIGHLILWCSAAVALSAESYRALKVVIYTVSIFGGSVGICFLVAAGLLPTKEEVAEEEKAKEREKAKKAQEAAQKRAAKEAWEREQEEKRLQAERKEREEEARRERQRREQQEKADRLQQLRNSPDDQW
ncbi:MAG: hypothetical protein QM758_13865 [Armatimonas sp.]